MIHEINTGMPAWPTRTYDLPDSAICTSVLFNGDSARTFRLFDARDRVNPIYSGVVQPGVEMRLGTLPRASRVFFDFDGHDDRIDEVFLFTMAPEVIGDSGVSRGRAPNYRALHYRFVGEGKPGAFVVHASAYPVTVTLYRAGTQVYTASVTSGRPVRFPHTTMTRASHWEVDIARAAGVEITGFVMVPVVIEDRDKTEIHYAQNKGIPAWITREYVFQTPTRFISAKVLTDSAVVMRYWLNGSSTQGGYFNIPAGGAEVLIDDLPPILGLQFDFSGQDDYVRQVSLFPRVVQMASQGVHEQHRQNWRKLQYALRDQDVPVVARMVANDYTNTRLTLYADNGIVYNELITSQRAFVLPRWLNPASEWTVDFPNTTPEIFQMLPRRTQVVNGDIHVFRSGDMPEWLHTRYEVPTEHRFTSVRVFADEYPISMHVFYNDAQGATLYEIESSAAVSLNDTTASALDFQFLGDETKIREVVIGARPMQNVGADGAFLSGDDVMGGVWLALGGCGAFACAQLHATAYPVTLTLRPIGGEDVTVEVEDGKPFMLSRILPESVQWWVQGDKPADGMIESLRLMVWRTVAMDNFQARVLAQDATIPAWMYSRFTVPDDAEPTGMLVRCMDDVTCEVFLDSSYIPAATLDLSDGDHPRLDDMGNATTFSFDFSGGDCLVTEAWLFCNQEQNFDGAISHHRLLNRRRIRLRMAAWGRPAVLQIISATDNYTSIKAWIYPRDSMANSLDNIHKWYGKVLSGEWIRLPRTLLLNDSWEIDIETDFEVSMMLVPEVRVQMAGPVTYLYDHIHMPPWLNVVHELRDQQYVMSAKVPDARFREKTTLNLYPDTSTTPSPTVLYNGREVPITRPTLPMNSFSFDFNEDNEYVGEVTLYPLEVIPVDNWGVAVRSGQPGQGWCCKRFAFPDTGTFTVARVLADDYAGMRLALYTKSGTLLCDVAVTGAAAFKLPEMVNAREWDLQLTHTGVVRELHLFTAQETQFNGKTIRMTRQTSPMTLLDRRYVTAMPCKMAAAQVLSDQYPVTFTLRNSLANTFTQEVANALPFRLPRWAATRQFAFDITGAAPADAVEEVRIGTSMAVLNGS